ncbi:hypothetical protein BLA28_26845 [Eisenbergiella tayi]|uniref:Lipoprotein LipO n=1 Tax=Eisenbergiella tayi TaxID=1432052 RepID=A0A1E3ATC2_9FIRM|nr:extracellular solute-binding protein [Eisenbergiella tayi]ODM11950.1 Lipoprotein LipO precursor [Eisenbergiella tayi]OIZ61066.1 hypothetical protein BLA28_26845 [Eisenbergiella tayi]
MRRKISKGLSIVLAMAVAGSLTACAGADKDTASSPAETRQTASEDAGTEAAAASEADPYGPVAEEITLHVGRSEDTGATYLDGQDSSNNYLVNYISEKLGVKYEYDFSVPSDTYETKVSMAITSGEFPDIMVVNESQLRQLVAAGAVEDMSDAYNKYASDNLKAAYDTTKGISFSSATFDGKLMGMPSISPGADGIPMLFVRGDWMEDLNLEAPKSVEDIVNIVEKFKAEKGTTNGLVVSSKIVNRGGNNTYGIDALFARYNSYPKHFITDADGNIVYGSNTAETKNALQEIRKLVESGVIDTSFVVRDSSTCEELITSGQAGIFFGAWWNMSWPLNNMIADDPSVFWNCYLAPLADDGKYNTAMISPSGSYLVVKAGSSEAVKEAAIKTMNYQFDIDQDQGVSLKADPTDPYSWTTMPFSILLSRYDDKEGKALAALAVVNGEKEESDLAGEALQWYESYQMATEDVKAAEEANNLAGWAYVRSAGLLGQEADNMNQIFDASYSRTETMDSKWATLEKLEDETFLKILNGEASIDAFDEYVEQWNALGGSDILAELEALKQ